MSITDELREYARIHQPYKSELYNAQCADEITAIADRIDAEHEKVEQDLIDANNQMEQLCECSVELPKDADDVPWKVGDRDEDGNVVTVLRLASDGWWVCSGGICRRPDRYRHHHAPTVEDVLTEFGIDWEHESDCEDRAALLREYASKLRLAEGEDE